MESTQDHSLTARGRDEHRREDPERLDEGDAPKSQSEEAMDGTPQHRLGNRDSQRLRALAQSHSPMAVLRAMRQNR